MLFPLVSVVVATYRRGESLRKAVESLYNQTYSNIEIIVVDDNDDSEWNDKVYSIIEDAKKKTSIPISLLVNHPNLGSAKTRNIGIDRAKGEYVAFLDDDDVFLPPKIEKQVKNMISENADYSVTDIALLYENNVLCEKRTREYLYTEGSDLLLCHLKYHLTSPDTMMFRRSYLLKIGCFEPIDVGDDFYLMMKAIQGGGKLSYLPECDVQAYVHAADGGLSSGMSKIQGENKLYEFKKSYIKDLNARNRSYIKMRHYAVLAFAYLRMKKYVHFICNGVKSFMSSPVDCFKLLKSWRK